MNLTKLAEPFPESDIEWRVGQAGKTREGAPWCKVLAYITNRAIMERLDEVCGPENWRNEYRYEANGAVLCGLSIRVTEPARQSSEWVTKWDGAENTDVEAVKGGLSNAMKRAGVQWGIGRYLYQLEEGWAEISEKGSNYVPANEKKGMVAFRWNPPKLPKWALPSSTEKPLTVTTGKGVTRPVESSVAVVAPADRIVKGKRLADYADDELNAMGKALRAEGRDKHKQLLADIGTVLNDRLLGPKKVKSDPLDDNARGERVKAMSGAPDDLPFTS